MVRFRLISISIIVILFFSCSQHKNNLPENLFGLKLLQKYTGETAKDLVDRLHQQNIVTEKNEIAFYGGEIGNATIYISYYKNENSAHQDYIKMTEKILSTNSIFSKGNYFNKNGKYVFNCIGLAQIHYVFAHENLLFWISVDPNISEKFFERYFEFVTK